MAGKPGCNGNDKTPHCFQSGANTDLGIGGGLMTLFANFKKKFDIPPGGEWDAGYLPGNISGLRRIIVKHKEDCFAVLSVPVKQHSGRMLAIFPLTKRGEWHAKEYANQVVANAWNIQNKKGE